MPTPAGDAKKPKGKLQARSRSRNSTPISGGTGNVSVVIDSGTTAYLHIPVTHLLVPTTVTLEDILDRGSTAGSIPTAGSLNSMHQTVKTQVLDHVRLRGEVCDRGMRELAKRRKERLEREREKERADREAEERRIKLKKVEKKKEQEEERPLAVGAHGVARQDGLGTRNEPSSSLSPPSSHGPPSLAGAGQNDASADSPALSEASHQPPPAPPVQRLQTFGPDPSKFDDPTIYHIRELTPDMGEEEKKAILCVAEYPHDDLHDLTCGTPPDRDFSNAKPTNQISFSAFSNYVEQFIRPLTEEDIAFLKERGDRVTPFVMPRRGPRHYKEIWAEEDGAMATDNAHDGDKLAPNQPRGSIDNMTDELAETNEISTGPVLARLLATLRPESRPPQEHATNGESMNGVVNGDVEADGEHQTDANPASNLQPPATQMPESTQPGWKAPPAPKMDYAAMDERIMMELRHIGFLGAEDTPDYDGHYDDEVAARLRYLQGELRRVSILNGARKARLLELAEERMAMQEYSTIADDLDSQLNQAYLKRNRNMGKGKKNAKRPGGGAAGSHLTPSGAGVSRPTVGEPIRSLMERRHQWNSIIGPVVNNGQATIPKETVFGDEIMKRLIAREQDSWNEAEEE